MEKMIQIRDSALCSTCSGRSSQFFNRNLQKALISEETCSNILEDCREPFLELAIYLRTVFVVGHVRLRKWRGELGANFILSNTGVYNGKDSVVTDIRDELNRKKLLPIVNAEFEGYGKKKLDSLQEIQRYMVEKILCENFVQIQTQPVIFIIDRVAKTGNATVQLGELMQKMVDKQKQKLGDQAYRSLISKLVNKFEAQIQQNMALEGEILYNDMVNSQVAKSPSSVSEVATVHKSSSPTPLKTSSSIKVKHPRSRSLDISSEIFDTPRVSLKSSQDYFNSDAEVSTTLQIDC